MAEPKEELNELTELLSAAQLEKLRLEVDDLRKKNSLADRVARYIPLMTAFVAVAGLFLGLWQFQRQQKLQQEKIITEQQKDRASQELDRTLRIQSQIRSDTDQMLHFTNDPQQTLSRVSFLLDELKTLSQQPTGEPQAGAQIIVNSRETVTRSLAQKIHYDCDFLKNPRDVYFATTVIDRWPDYSQYLSQSPRELDFILYKYVRAVRDLHDRNPKYFEKLVFDRSSGRYIVDSESFNEEHQFQHYGDIVIGFVKHLSISQDSDLMKKHIEDFKAALRNPNLSRQIFTEYLPTYSSEHTEPSEKIDSTPANGRVFELTPGAIRGPGKLDRIILSGSEKKFTITLRLRIEGVYEGYRASVFNLNGQLVWQGSGITTNERDEIKITLSSGLFSMADYVLAIDGERSTGEMEILARYYFRVEKK